jgi:hypothetical protein
VFLTTLGTDEAWVLNGLRSYLRPPVPNLSSEPVVTNGGLFALVNLGLEYAFGSSVWVHRLFSLSSLLALVAIVSWQARSMQRSARLDYLAIAPLLGIAGTAEVGTAALGTSTAVALAALAGLIWSGSAAPGIGRIMLCGLLFGLGASSRFDLVLFAPALLLASSLDLEDRSRPRLKVPWGAVAVVVLGLGVFAINQVLMAGAAHPIVASRLNAEETMAVTGISGPFLDYPRVLNRLTIAIGFASPALMVLASAAPFCRHAKEARHSQGSGTRFVVLVLTMAWVLWLGWMLRAPIPHLRYLWPSLGLFAVAGGVGLSTLHQSYVQVSDSPKALLCRLVALGLVLGGLGGTFRSLVMGEGDYLSWEWSREMGLDYFRRFQHLRDQRSAAAYLRNEIARDATVLAYVPFSLRYLGDRPVVAAGAPVAAQGGEHKTFLILSPEVGTYFYLPPETFEWIEAHGRLTAQFGRYSFYELPAGPPRDASVLRLSRTNYEKHPGSQYWFGRGGPPQRLRER